MRWRITRDGSRREGRAAPGRAGMPPTLRGTLGDSGQRSQVAARTQPLQQHATRTESCPKSCWHSSLRNRTRRCSLESLYRWSIQRWFGLTHLTKPTLHLPTVTILAILQRPPSCPLPDERLHECPTSPDRHRVLDTERVLLSNPFAPLLTLLSCIALRCQ